MDAGKKKPNKKIPKKKKTLRELRKPITIGGIISAIAIAGIISGFYLIETTKKGGVFYFGLGPNLDTFDPIEVLVNDAFDGHNNMILGQVFEGLFFIEVTSAGESRIVPNLAIDKEWSNNGINLTCNLRQGVKFHDGTPFNASAVKWNIDRIHRLFNNTFYSLVWQLPDGRWIINQTHVINDFTIRFVLNEPFVPLLALLASPTSHIQSPASTPVNNFNDINNDGPVGTGPFIFDHFEVDNNITMAPNTLYWGDKPKIDRLVFRIIHNDTIRRQEMLSKEFSMTYVVHKNLDPYLDIPELRIREVTNPQNSYIIMNTKKINTTMRKAVSYAFNYTSYFEEIIFNPAIRCKSPIPKGMLFSNWNDFIVPEYNISTARQILKDANWPGTSDLTVNNNISAGNEWETITNSLSPLATYNFTYAYGWWALEQSFILLEKNLKQIGVKLKADIVTPAQWNAMIVEYGGYNRDMFDFTRMGWAADYYDPYNMITPLFSNKKPNVNVCQVNNSQLQQLIDKGLLETNDTARGQIYYDIQKLLIEELFPVVWLQTNTFYEIYLDNVRGLSYPGAGLFFKGVYFV
ncbi:MAG: ABC transporter substrate-binding protein [Promethearchaeota archaeon]|jgi:peptide/nickel transport system substrate-binding protein